MSRCNPIKIKISKTTENSPLNSALQSPRVPKTIQNIMNKSRLVVSFIPSLVFNKRKLNVTPRVNRKFHCNCKNHIIQELDRMPIRRSQREKFFTMFK